MQNSDFITLFDTEGGLYGTEGFEMKCLHNRQILRPRREFEHDFLRKQVKVNINEVLVDLSSTKMCADCVTEATSTGL